MALIPAKLPASNFTFDYSCIVSINVNSGNKNIFWLLEGNSFDLIPPWVPVDNWGFADRMLGISGLGNLTLSLVLQTYDIWIVSGFCPWSVLFLELSWHNKAEVCFLLNPCVLWDAWNFRVIILYLAAVLAPLFM